MSADALVLAACASLAGALAAVFQSRGAKSVAPARANGIGLLLALLRSRVWLLGVVIAGASGLFHALALRKGPLVAVEAIMVTSLLFALALGILVARAPVTARDWSGAAATILGLVSFLVFADPQDGDYSVPLVRWVVVLGTLLAITAMLVLVGRRATAPNTRASLFALAAAVCLGTAAVLLKVITSLLGDGEIPALVGALALLGVFELGALVFQQIAFRAGSLAAALAPFVGGNPMIAGAVGIVLFGERFHTEVGDLLGALVGIALVVGGIGILASSPAVAAGSGEDASSSPPEV